MLSACSGDELASSGTAEGELPVAIPRIEVQPENSPATTTTAATSDALLPDAEIGPDGELIEPEPFSPSGEGSGEVARTEATGLPEDLVALFLDGGDLGGDWLVGDFNRYRPDPVGADDVAECPALAAIDAIDAILEVQRDFGLVDINDVTQIIGRAPDATAAAQLVTDFAAVDACWQHLLDEQSSEFNEGEPAFPTQNSVTIDEVFFEGAGSANKTLLMLDGEWLAIVLFAVDDVVTLVAFDQEALAQSDISLDVAAKAANKIAAAR